MKSRNDSQGAWQCAASTSAELRDRFGFVLGSIPVVAIHDAEVSLGQCKTLPGMHSLAIDINRVTTVTTRRLHLCYVCFQFLIRVR